MSNRAEDLESQVADLQATVDGLTEELVETKERVRQLEAQTEELKAAADAPSQQRTGQSTSESRSTADEQADARGTDERRDAEFVANRDTDEPAQEAPGEEQEAVDEDDDDDGDDIIVA